MVCANLLNWVIGGRIMRAMGVMIRVPKQVLLPSVLLVTLTAIYVQETSDGRDLVHPGLWRSGLSVPPA